MGLQPHSGVSHWPFLCPGGCWVFLLCSIQTSSVFCLNFLGKVFVKSIRLDLIAVCISLVAGFPVCLYGRFFAVHWLDWTSQFAILQCYYLVKLFTRKYPSTFKFSVACMPTYTFINGRGLAWLAVGPFVCLFLCYHCSDLEECLVPLLLLHITLSLLLLGTCTSMVDLGSLLHAFLSAITCT